MAKRIFRPLTYEYVPVDRKTKHGMSRTYFYRVWTSMKSRCSIENNPAYVNYGGRGIKVCERWLIFENFRDDMFETYLKQIEKFGTKDTSLDRTNNDGNYEATNCVWATRKEQCLNRRSSVVGEINKRAYRMTGVVTSRVYKNRIDNGWDLEEAKTTLPYKRKDRSNIGRPKKTVPHL